MTSSSARPVNQRYHAGRCTLDVVLQMSALSQWTVQPIAQSLRFKLWLRPADDAASELVAEGDSEALQALAQHIQQQTRATLVLSNFNANLNAPMALPPAAQLPSGQTLSYLQLCDLTSVLSQYEQAAQVLSVALTPAEAPTVLQASSQTHLQPDSQTRPQLTTPRTRGVVVPFAALRRRSRLWASSAAAAVFVGGVTTALWPQISNQTNQTVAEYNADSTAPRSESAPNAEPESAAPRQPGQPSESAPASRSDSRTDSRTANRAPATNSGPNPSINQPSVDQPAAGNETLPSRSDKAPDTPVAPTDVPSNSAQADLENSSESVAPATPPATNSATANSNPPPSAVAQSREENADAAISTARQSSPDAGAATFGAAAPVPEADTLDQVRAYFQSRWQPSDLAVQPPLSYQLELSAAGEVIGFTALNEAAEESRDRLLPADNPPVFSPIAPDSGSDAGGLTLNIVLTADGQVQVSQP